MIQWKPAEDGRWSMLLLLPLAVVGPPVLAACLVLSCPTHRLTAGAASVSPFSPASRPRSSSSARSGRTQASAAGSSSWWVGSPRSSPFLFFAVGMMAP